MTKSDGLKSADLAALAATALLDRVSQQGETGQPEGAKEFVWAV
jgi:hypothetical protein